MAIGACGYQSIAVGTYRERPMDANGWLLVLVDTNGYALLVWRPMDTNGWLLVLVDGYG